MKLFLTVISVLVLSVSSAYAQSADTVADIARLDRALFDACWRADDGARDRLVTDDFVYTTHAGEKLTKAEWKALVMIPAAPYDQFTLTEHTVQVYGDTAIASGYVELLFDLKSGPARGEYRFSNVYVRRDGQWRAAFGQVTPGNKLRWKRSLKPPSAGEHGVMPPTTAPN